MPLRTKQFLLGGVALVAAIALPAIAQDQPESILPPGFGDPATPAPEPATNGTEPAAPTPSRRPSIEDSLVEMVDSLISGELNEEEVVPQVEYPDTARRDPRYAG